MDNMPKADALNLISRWERQNQSISVFCFSSSVALSSKNARFAICLDECIEILLADDTVLHIFTSDAVFNRVEADDFPTQTLHVVPKFQHGIRIDFPDKQMQWYLLASLPPGRL
jgi:hypothetical protein